MEISWYAFTSYLFHLLFWEICNACFIMFNEFDTAGLLKYNYLDRDVFDEKHQLIKEDKLSPDIGRMRSIEQCADGYIYFCLEEPESIYRIVPL